MREIKFRGLRADGIWEYGDLYTVPEKGWTLIRNRVDGERFFVSPETVGQYTGLLDADGREIYEGDIVKFIKPAYTDVPVVITWEDGAFMVDHDLYLGGRDLSRVTVIGNIYDNLELLERKP